MLGKLHVVKQQGGRRDEFETQEHIHTRNLYAYMSVSQHISLRCICTQKLRQRSKLFLHLLRNYKAGS